MTRTRRRALILVPVVLAVLASVSIDTGRTLRVVDNTGTPLPGVLVVYHHEGTRFNPVHPTTYEASRESIAQGSLAGLVEIPWSIHFHVPFPVESGPRISVDLIYAPTLHNGLATIRGSAVRQAGAFEVAHDLATVTLTDLAPNPQLWQGTLMNVASVINRLQYDEAHGQPARRRSTDQTPALTRLLIGHFSREYDAYQARYRDVARPRPTMPDALRLSSTEAERRSWEEMVDRDLAREPRWGDLAERLFAREVARFNASQR